MTGVMVFGRVALVLAAVSLVTTTVTATESVQTTCFIDTAPSAATASADDDAVPPHRYYGPSNAFLGANCIQFHLVDTARNATMFRLHHGEVIDNYFAKGRPVAVRVDVLAIPYSAGGCGMRLFYNGDGGVVGEERERYVPTRPYAFGGVDHVAAPDGKSSLRLVPLVSLGQYGNHTFTAILVDKYGLDRAKSTITVSVVTEQQQHSYNNGQPQQELFMDAPEREAFLRRITILHDNNRAAAVSHGGDADDDGSSSSAIMMMRSTNRHHRLVPSQRRVRLAGLPVKYFLHRSNRRKSSP
jgi:hypothetical protein